MDVALLTLLCWVGWAALSAGVLLTIASLIWIAVIVRRNS